MNDSSNKVYQLTCIDISKDTISPIPFISVMGLLNRENFVESWHSAKYEFCSIANSLLSLLAEDRKFIHFVKYGN